MKVRESPNVDGSLTPLSLGSAAGAVRPRDAEARQQPSDDYLKRYWHVLPGDLVVNPMWLIGGSIGVSWTEGAVSPDYRVYSPGPTVDARYLHHLLRSKPYFEQYNLLVRAQTTFDRRITKQDFHELPIPVPPLEEQRAIADYLDTETARIDALITKKRRMIELISERQVELERNLVTGLFSAPDEQYVETGNSSVPQLPASWKLIRARFLCDVETGSSDTDESAVDGAYPFFVRSQTPQSSDRFLFDGEAVLTAGDGAGVGKVYHHFVGKFDAHQRVYVLHRFRHVIGRYFYYFFSAFFGLAALDGSAKSTVDSVRRHMITELPVALPPLDEQQRLVDELDRSRIRVDALRPYLDRQVLLLVEHRQALITAAVTGELEIPVAP